MCPFLRYVSSEGIACLPIESMTVACTTYGQNVCDMPPNLNAACVGPLLHVRIRIAFHPVSDMKFQNRKITTVLAISALTMVTVQGCRGTQEPASITRVADAIYGAGPGSSDSTAHYPRVELGGQTRVVAKSSGAFGSTRIHVSVGLELSANPTVELAYGLGPAVPTGSKVTFTTNVSNKDGNDVTHTKEIVAGPGTTGVWIEDALVLEGWSSPIDLEIQSFSAGDLSEQVYVAAPVIASTGVPDPRLNLLLISLDTLRADHLGIYGYDRDTSPNIDRRFGRDGLVVEHAYSQASDTVLGHTAMLFGMDPCKGVAPASGNTWRQNPSTLGLAERLQRVGYRTAAFTENAMVAGSWGFARGFDVYDEEKSSETAEVTENGTPGFVRQTFDRGVAWLDANHQDRFFVFLHTYQVHAPYTPSPEHAHAFTPAAGEGDVPGRDRDLYDAEVRYTDAEIERLMVKLEGLGVLENTIVIVTSDHGEEFNEHGGRYHGWQVYDEAIRVPLLIAGPGLPDGGIRRPGPVALIDLLPTLLDLLGVDQVTATTEPDGVSVAEHLRIGTPLGPTRELYAEARAAIKWTYDGADSDWLRPNYALLSWPNKLIRRLTPSGIRYELYDLLTDPAERSDLFANAGEKSARLVAMIEAHAAQCASEQAALRSVYAAGGAGLVSPDKVRDEKLRTLGYIE